MMGRMDPSMPRKPRCPACSSGKFRRDNGEWVCKTCGYSGPMRQRSKKGKKPRGMW